MKSMEEAKPPAKKQTFVMGAVIVGLLIIVVGLGWNYLQLSKHSRTADQIIIKKVSALYELPTDEKPTVVQVENKAELSNQPFYGKAQKGDYVLVYAKNKLALIYRQQADKLINVGPVNFVAQ
jgi:hypothetical protein